MNIARTSLALVGGLLSAIVPIGCDSEPETTARLSFSLTWPGDASLLACFAISILDADAESTFEAGDHAAVYATLHEALASGAVCVRDTASLIGPCTAGPSKARASLVGFYEDGPLVQRRFLSPCDGSCDLSFDCVSGEETSVDFTFTPERHPQGFFDIGVMGPGVEGGAGVCYTLRVVNGVGVHFYSWGPICSTDYGDGPGGDITIILACDAETAENTLTVWVHPPEGVAGFDNPCPAPDSGAVETWVGGCSKTVRCNKNEDTPVLFDFESEAR